MSTFVQKKRCSRDGYNFIDYILLSQTIQNNDIYSKIAFDLLVTMKL